MNEAMNVIADNAELAENFAETIKNEIASDDDAYAHIGFHLANDIRNQSPASEVLLTLCGWNIDTLLDKTPPIAIDEGDNNNEKKSINTYSSTYCSSTDRGKWLSAGYRRHKI